MNTKNKVLIILSFLILGTGISFIAFSWSEPDGSMPSGLKIPLNTSIEDQDVDEEKPKIGFLDSDKLDGYDSSDLLAASNGSSCPDNYGNLCLNGGGLEFTYEGRTMYIDAFPRAAGWRGDSSPFQQALAWQMCQDIGARLPTLAEWRAACVALSGPNGNGRTTFGGVNNSSRYEWVADPSPNGHDQALLAGGASCQRTMEESVFAISYRWFRCIR